VLKYAFTRHFFINRYDIDFIFFHLSACSDYCDIVMLFIAARFTHFSPFGIINILKGHAQAITAPQNTKAQKYKNKKTRKNFFHNHPPPPLILSCHKTAG